MKLVTNLKTCKEKRAETEMKLFTDLKTCKEKRAETEEKLKTCNEKGAETEEKLKTCNEKGAETEENLRLALSREQELSMELANMTEWRDIALIELNEIKDAFVKVVQEKKDALEEVEVQKAKYEAVAVVHGSWSDFGDFGECSTQCGRGFKTRFRTCDHPKPKNGGDDCIGEMESVAQCQGPKKFEFVTEEGFCSEAHTELELAAPRSLIECEEECEIDPSCTVVVQDQHGCVTLSTCSEILPAKDTGSFVRRKSSCDLPITKPTGMATGKPKEKKN